LKVLINRTTLLTHIFNTAAVPPRWILEPTDKAFAQGSEARVECKADGFPKPQVTWKRAAGELTYFNNFTLSN
jgi:hypothetical protein